VKRLLRTVMLAAYFALAASEHESMWTHLDSRPVAVLPIGEPALPLVPRRAG